MRWGTDVAGLGCRALARSVGLGVALASSEAAMAEDPAQAEEVLVEFHFQPVPNAQIAIWLEDLHGNFVADVFVTQATGTLGIGNRPGRWDFLSSWRFPYGPRPGVLPVWGHARGKNYPEVVFHDGDPSDANSLGWHENSSSPEPYFCRPLTSVEHDNISTDTMTCPSPATFQSDKGQFSDGTSVYPPRGDLTSYEPIHDHPDVQSFASLNDLDAVTGATPSGLEPEILTAMLPAEALGQGDLMAFIEVNLEDDANAHWSFDREDDHFVDPRLSGYGIPYLGQPSVVYQVQFDPTQRAFTWTDSYAGYGDLRGESGTVHPPDDTISQTDGSGADRLEVQTKNGIDFRFGVFSHGPPGLPPDPDEPDWSGCSKRELPAMTDVELDPVGFDRVRVHFTVPTFDGQTTLKNVRLFYRPASEGELNDENAGGAYQQVPAAENCGEDLVSGVTTWCEVDQLFGSTEYQVGIRYEDTCNNVSRIVAGAVTTPQQEFATVEGLCFVATAAWGAPWAERVQGLRWFRDLYLKQSSVGSALVRFYYANSPALAALVARHPLARGMARAALSPLTEVAVAMTHPPTSRDR